MVFAMSLVWKIFSLKISLWVSWIHHYLLRHESFWEVKENGRGSWVWRKLLKLRPLVYQFIRFEVNDDHTTYFWFDDWLKMGKLIDITGDVGTYYFGVARNAKVKDAVLHSNWSVRGSRSRQFHALHERIHATEVPQDSRGCDVVLWKHSADTYKTVFSSVRTWDQIRDKRAIVFWNKSVWFSQGVPRYSFIVWLAVKDRLSTGVRMRAWGLQQSCVFCGERDETRDHLFFACSYSFTVWDKLASGLMAGRTDPDWLLTLQYVSSNTLCVEDKVLMKMVFQGCVYHIWREMNGRRHHTSFQTVRQITRMIDKAVRNRITSLRYKHDHRLAGLMGRWFEVTV